MQPVTISERLAHITAAKKSLDTRIPWLADSMANDLKHAFGDRPNSEFVVAPDGKVVVARSWSDPVQLRADLENLVGKADTLTAPADLQRNFEPLADGDHDIPGDVLPRVERPPGAAALVVKAIPPQPDTDETQPTDPFYVKLRAEAPRELLKGGEGRLYLGFRLDPIHKMHWNNLAPPLQYEIAAPEGVAVSPASGEAAKVEGHDADSGPREFLIDVDFGDKSPGDSPLKLRVRYFACDDAGQFCITMTQDFVVEWQEDRDAGSVRIPGSRGRSSAAADSRQRPKAAQLFQRMDRDGDGRVSEKEAAGPMKQRFKEIDGDRDGFITEAELKKRLEQRNRR